MHQDHLRLRDREQDEDVRQALAHTTNNQASFGGSLLKNNMEVEAVMEMQLHLDETTLSLHLLCMWGVWVCIRFDQSLHGLPEVVNPWLHRYTWFTKRFTSRLHGLHKVYIPTGVLSGKITPLEFVQTQCKHKVNQCKPNVNKA